MKRFAAILLPIFILAGFGWGGFAFLQSLKKAPAKADTPPQALAVFVEPVERLDYAQTVVAQGEVRPRRETIIAPEVNGRVSWISDSMVDGGIVRRGQVLARLETTDYELGVVRAEATVAGARQTLAREQAAAEVALRDIEELGLQNTTALARHVPQLAEARAALQSAQAQLRDAELALERTVIAAPFDGRVVEKTVDIGQFVTAGGGLGRMFATDLVEVALPVTDRDLGRIGLPLAFNESAEAPGPKVIFRAQVGGRERQWVGRVTRTSATVNSQTRLINVFGELEDPYGAGMDDGAPMAPGLFVDAAIEGVIIPDILRIPRAGLRGNDRVFVADPVSDTLTIRQVDVAHSQADGAYLYGGVEAGEEVIVSPVQAAFHGMRVQILRRRPDGSVEQDPMTNNAKSAQTVADAALSAETQVTKN